MEPIRLRVASLRELAEKGRLLLRHRGKQIAVFHTKAGVFACNNRCPHEGYPLMEGTLDQDCRLTCNWHAWRFDLRDGSSEEGDHVRVYPVTVEEGEVFVDVAEPPAAQRIAQALASLEKALDRRDRGRIAREIARLEKAGGEPLQAVTRAIAATAERFPYGMSHSQGAASDWLRLRERHAESPAEKLVPLVEVIDHVIEDSRGERARPFAAESEDYEPQKLVGAILASDDQGIARLIRGALAEDRAWSDLEPALARAAFAHYADFGHAAIYCYKAGELLNRLGEEALEPLALLLAREISEAWREDLIPEFRAYRPSLEAWDDTKAEPVEAADFRGLGVKQALARALRSAGRRQELHQALLGAAAWNFLHFNLSLERRADLSPADSKTWLSFTHAITFANAGRALSERYPDLWPPFLLQLACFVGRNADAVTNENLEEEWRVEDGEAFLKQTFRSLFDHGVAEPIVTAHLVKLTTAVEEEIAAAPQAPWRETMLAGLNRLLANPPHRPQALRLATQALTFVARED